MASAMDVDESSQEMVPAATAAPAALLVHPLAIVSMSDQFTRITTGGSPLPKTQAVVGLLFGQGHGVTDAEDVPLQNSEKATTQVQLHRAVFPQHVVVGWYRVVNTTTSSSSSSSSSSTTNAPTPEDLYLSLQLQKQYGTQADSDDPNIDTNISNSSNISNNTAIPFLFVLLQVETENDEPLDDNKSCNESAELPLQIFAVDPARQVLVGVDDWKLETATAERIAVERVMKEPTPQQQQQQQPAFSDPDDATSKNNYARQSSLLVQATTPIQHSLRAMHERWGLVQEYLEATTTAAAGTTTAVPSDPVLLRQIQGLLLSMGPMALENVESAAAGGRTVTTVDDLLQQLNVLAKTVTTIQQYTDKVRLVHDTSPSLGGGGGTIGTSGRVARGRMASLFSGN